MNEPNQAQVLVALQDLEEMLAEAEDPSQREQLEEMGFPVTGLEELQASLEKLEGRISRAELTRYRRLHQRMGRAIVPVIDGTCTGCFTNVPSIFTSSVNLGKVINCETCGRMLYWP